MHAKGSTVSGTTRTERTTGILFVGRAGVTAADVAASMGVATVGATPRSGSERRGAAGDGDDWANSGGTPHPAAPSTTTRAYASAGPPRLSTGVAYVISSRGGTFARTAVMPPGAGVHPVRACGGYATHVDVRHQMVTGLALHDVEGVVATGWSRGSW